MWTGIVALLAAVIGKAKRSPKLPESSFVHLRPPVPQSEREMLSILSGGRMTWDRSGFQQRGFGVSVDFSGSAAATQVIFNEQFPPHLLVDRLQIGIPVAELLRRYPSMTRQAPIVDAEEPHLYLANYDEYAGANTASGHEIVALVRDGVVSAFRINIPGRHEAGRDFLRRSIANKVRFREERAARLAHERRYLGSLLTTREEDDAMLAAWAAENDQAKGLAAWLPSATPDERHSVAMAWNWDLGEEPLFWMIRRDDCDLATAMLVFERSEPDFYAGYEQKFSKLDASFLKGFWLTSEIFERWRQGFYKRSDIAWSPFTPMPERVLDREGRAHDIPEQMLAPLTGREIEPHPNSGVMEGLT